MADARLAKKSHMKEQKITLFDLPADVIQKLILSRVDPKTLASVAYVNRALSKHALNNNLWEYKTRQHFSNKANNVKATSNIIWRKQCSHFFKKDYKGLELNLKEAFSLIKELQKEGDSIQAYDLAILIEDLKNINFKLSDLETRDGSNFSLAYWAKRKGGRLLQNHFYLCAKQELSDKKSKLDVKKVDSLQKTILHHAVAFEQPATTIQGLIKQGAAVDACDWRNRTPLFYAVENGNQALAKLLLKRDADIEAKDVNGKTPLKLAVNCQDEGMVSLLLAAKAKCDVFDSKGITPLCEAIHAKNHVVIKLLLSAGANINLAMNNPERYTPLHVAVLNNHYDTLKYLLDLNQGLKLNLNFDAKTANDYAALHLAAQKGYADIIKILVKNGASIDIETDAIVQMTPLYVAANLGHVEAVQALLDAGANFKIKCGLLHDSLTPLAIAKAQGHIDVVHAIYKQRFVNCESKLTQKPKDQGNTATGFFKYSAEKRQSALQAFRGVLFAGADRASLSKENKKILKSDKEMEKIYRHFKKRK